MYTLILKGNVAMSRVVYAVTDGKNTFIHHTQGPSCDPTTFTPPLNTGGQTPTPSTPRSDASVANALPNARAAVSPSASSGPAVSVGKRDVSSQLAAPGFATAGATAPATTSTPTAQASTVTAAASTPAIKLVASTPASSVAAVAAKPASPVTAAAAAAAAVDNENGGPRLFNSSAPAPYTLPIPSGVDPVPFVHDPVKGVLKVATNNSTPVNNTAPPAGNSSSQAQGKPAASMAQAVMGSGPSAAAAAAVPSPSVPATAGMPRPSGLGASLLSQAYGAIGSNLNPVPNTLPAATADSQQLPPPPATVRIAIGRNYLCVPCFMHRV